VRIGVDIDGVVADFVSAANGWVSREYGILSIPATTWNWFEGYPGGAAKWAALWDKGIRQEKLLLTCAVIPGARHTVQRMMRHHEVVFVTYRPEDVMDQTHTWLERNIGRGFELMRTDDKSEAKADLHIDDHPETVDALRRSGLRSVLFRQPWNRNWWTTLPSFNGWGDISMALDGWDMQ
jgi:uncharacterized HAD superfamily protein